MPKQRTGKPGKLLNLGTPIKITPHLAGSSVKFFKQFYLEFIRI